jgi:hypothetical protein
MNANRMNDIMSDGYLDKVMDKRMSRAQTDWWYIYGSIPDNKTHRTKQYLLGGYSSYDEANRVANAKRLTDVNYCSLPTKDISRAGQILKARRLQGNSTMSEVLQRVSHKNVGDGI